MDFSIYGVGKDALILNDIVKTELTCYKKSICKAGFPETSLAKYIELIKKAKIMAVIYDYAKDTDTSTEYNGKKYNMLLKLQGKKIIVEKEYKDCSTCKSNKQNNVENTTEQNILVIQILKEVSNMMNEKMDKIIQEIQKLAKGGENNERK